MEKRTLIRHPQSEADDAVQIEAELGAGAGGRLLISFAVTGPVSGIRWPQASKPLRTDGLWRSTCFEAFVRAAGDEPYYEFNFSPSGEWAAYRFDSRRTGMRPAEEVRTPPIETASTAGRLELRTAINLDQISRLREEATVQLALSAVLEGAGGAKSYWALAHQPGAPDFHDPQNFILEIHREAAA